MPLREHPGRQRRFSPWQVCICFLLATFFLYNPFFTVYGSSPMVKVLHPRSYRATVASSELRRSRVTEVQPKVLAPEQTAPPAVAPSRHSTVLAGVPEHQPLDFQVQSLSESLWFRPPPVS